MAGVMEGMADMPRIKDSGQYKGFLHMRISEWLHKEASRLAAGEGKSLSDFVRELLEWRVNGANGANGMEWGKKNKCG